MINNLKNKIKKIKGRFTLGKVLVFLSFLCIIIVYIYIHLTAAIEKEQLEDLIQNYKGLVQKEEDNYLSNNYLYNDYHRLYKLIMENEDLTPLKEIMEELKESFNLRYFVCKNFETIMNAIKTKNNTELVDLILKSQQECPKKYVELFKEFIEYLEYSKDKKLITISQEEYHFLRIESNSLSKLVSNKDISKIK